MNISFETNKKRGGDGSQPHTVSGAVAALLGAGLLAGPARGQDAKPVGPAAKPTTPAASAAKPAAAPAAPKPGLTLFGNWRVRQEVWDWFGDDNGAGKYTYTGSLLRFGGNYVGKKYDATLELAQPTLLNLPKDATLGAPFGQLGQGSSYRDANAPQEASLFVKQAFVRAKGIAGKGGSARVGRIEFIDGTETVPKDASLAYLKRERIAHRLIGNFGFTHVQRSFDGGQFVHNTPDQNITLFAGMPTEGVFDLDGGATLDDIKIGYAAVTRPFAGKTVRGETRLFGLYYLDEREEAVKTDNRPLPVRRADKQDVQINTIGGHALAIADTPTGQVDGVLWGAGQFGGWGSQGHSAFAGAAEIGYQPKGIPWKPWIRAGFFHASGDGDPADGQHETFHSALLTPRIYARFPFYTLSNLNDGFVQVIARPNPKLTLRSDAHVLWLADESDLWYIGGGAFQNPTFGFAGRPSNGKRGLGTLADVSIDYQWRKDTTFTGYFGYAWGGNVVDSIYGGGSNGFMGYLEVSRRF